MSSHTVYFLSMQVNMDLLCDLLYLSRTALKSPEILLVLLTCPLLQDDSSVMDKVLRVAITIAELSEKTLDILSKHSTLDLIKIGSRTV